MRMKGKKMRTPMGRTGGHVMSLKDEANFGAQVGRRGSFVSRQIVPTPRSTGRPTMVEPGVKAVAGVQGGYLTKGQGRKGSKRKGSY